MFLKPASKENPDQTCKGFLFRTPSFAVLSLVLFNGLSQIDSVNKIYWIYRRLYANMPFFCYRCNTVKLQYSFKRNLDKKINKLSQNIINKPSLRELKITTQNIT